LLTCVGIWQIKAKKFALDFGSTPAAPAASKKASTPKKSPKKPPVKQESDSDSDSDAKKKADTNDDGADTSDEEAAPKKKPPVKKSPAAAPSKDPYEGLNSKERRLLKRKLDRGDGAPEESPAKKKAASPKKPPSKAAKADSSDSSDSDDEAEKPTKAAKKSPVANAAKSPKAAAASKDPYKGLNSKEKRLLKRKIERDGFDPSAGAETTAPVKKAAAKDDSSSNDDSDDGAAKAGNGAAVVAAGKDPYEGLNSKEKRLLKRKLDRGEDEAPVAKSLPKQAAAVAVEDGEDPYEGLNSKERRLLKRQLDRGDEHVPAAASAASGGHRAAAAAEDEGPKVEESARVCLRNLHRHITEEALMGCFGSCLNDESDLINIKWITDKETQQFYGTAFLEFSTPEIARRALKKNGDELMGREVFVEITQPLKKKVKKEIRPMGDKPDGCLKVFVGNVAYESTDDELGVLFGKCGDVKMVRWLTKQDTGEFRGCGFIEFYTTEAVDEAIKLAGTEMHGRALRVDYS